MVVLLWGRFVLLGALASVVVGYVWATLRSRA
jgi:hypothetical protein